MMVYHSLQADQLFDMNTGEFKCTFCREVVEEDQSALPKKDSRLLLAKFNEQLEPLYILLREVEGIKLAPEILEPEPVDINTIRGYVYRIEMTHSKKKNKRKQNFLSCSSGSTRESRVVCARPENNGPAKRRAVVVSLSRMRESMLLSVTRALTTMRLIAERKGPYG